jgi:hypothetical protein
MLSRTAVLTILGLFAMASPFAITACSSGDSSDNASDPTDDEVKSGVAEGGSCNDAHKCKTGLLCKAHSSGPPPGALGLPMPPSSSTSHGPPPGALGLPLPPGSGTCQKPANGEEGGLCNVNIPCLPGLVCEYPSSGPPPGALGLPMPPSSSTSHGPPPGTMGLPLIKNGTCKPKSSGPPPGALGLPLPAHS